MHAEAAALPQECATTREAWGGGGARDRADPRADGRPGGQPMDGEAAEAAESAPLALKVMGVRDGQWGSARGLQFLARGQLVTPWGTGKWGALHGQPSALFADFGGAQHELDFGAWPEFVSTRCSDGQVVRGSMLPST